MNLYDLTLLVVVVEGVPDDLELQKYGKEEWRWIRKMSSIPGVSFTTGGGNGMTKESAFSHRGFMKAVDSVNSKGGDMMVTPMMRLGTLFMGIFSDGLNPLMASGTFRSIRESPQFGNSSAVTPEMLSLLQTDSNVKAAIISELESIRGSGAYGIHFIGYKTMRQWVWPWSTNPENQRSDSLLFAPQKEGKSVWEYVYDVMTHPERPHGGVLVRPLYNYGAFSMEPLREMFQHDKVVAGFADGGAHGKGQNEATTPTTMLTFWCRDRLPECGEQLPIEMVVRKQTRDSARMMVSEEKREKKPYAIHACMQVLQCENLWWRSILVLIVVYDVRGLKIEAKS